MKQQMTFLGKNIENKRCLAFNGDWASGIGELGGMGGY
jgi:hypothetical protein